MNTIIRIASISLLLWSTLSFAPSDNQKKKAKTQLTKEHWQKILEEQRVVDPLSSEGQIFQSEMLEVLKKRYPSHDFSKNPVQFFLLDQDRDHAQDSVNVWTAKKDGVEYYAFSKGVINKIKYRDTINWILGHEYEHRRYREKHGEQKVEKGEEALCDINSLTTTIKNKENHIAVLDELAGKIFTRIRPSLEEFLDVHPLDQNRIRILQTKAGELITKEGYTAPAPTLWQSPTKAVLSKAIHYSTIDNLKQQANWEQLDTVKKLEVIHHFIETEKAWNDAKTSDLVKTFLKITIDRRNEKERNIQDKIANTILDSKHSIPTRIYDALSRSTRFLESSYPPGKLKVGHDAIPLGHLVDVQKKLVHFSQASNLEEARDRATALKESLKKAEGRFNNAYAIEFSNFEFPDLEAAELAVKKRKKTGKGNLVKVSWDDFIRWAKEDRSKKIVETLWAIEVHDPRLFELMTPQLAFEASIKTPSRSLDSAYDGVTGSAKKQIVRGPHDGSTIIEGIKISEKGNVLGVVGVTSAELERDRSDRFRYLADQYSSELVYKAINGDKEAAALVERHEIKLNSIVGVEIAYKNPILFFSANQPALMKNKDSKSQINQEMKKWLSDFTEEKRKAIIELFKADPGYFFSEAKIAVTVKFNPNTPFSKILLDNVNKLFQNKEELSNFLLAIQDSSLRGDFSVGGIPYYKQNENIDLHSLFRLVGATQPSTDEEANLLLKEFPKKTEIERKLLICHLIQEIRKRGGENVKVDPFLFVTEASKFIKEENMNNPMVRDLDDLARDINRITLEPFVKKINWPNDLNKKIDLWVLLHEKNLWKDGLSERKLKSIVEAILKTQGSKKIKYIEKLLSSDFIPFPQLRSQLENELTLTLATELGKDNGRKEYRQKLIEVLNHLDSILGYAEKRNIFSELANRTEAQAACSQEFSQRLRLDNPQHIKGTTNSGAAIEFFMRVAQAVPEVRKDVQELLISDGTQETIKKITESVLKNCSDLLTQDEYLKLLDFSAGEGELGEKVFKQYTSEKARTLWLNFWAAPLEARAVLYENILFPKVETSLDKLQEGFNFVMNKLFPGKEPHSETSKKFLRTYFEVLDPTQRRIFIAASIVAAQKNQSAENKLSIGQRLALVFELLGPAEIKLGQAIHSHPSTPEDIKEGVERLKAHAAPPERWELLEWVKTIPESERKLYQRIGKVLGSGSYFVTAEVEMKDGSTQVIQILRPYSLERSQRGFELLYQMGEKLQGIVEPETLSIVQEAIQQAHDRAVPETNNEVASQQFKLAKELYHDAKINVNGTEIVLEVPNMFATGANYRRMSKGEGVHFNELPFESAEQKLAKKNIAKAYLGYELLLILNGGHFDLDRHQAQMRVKKMGENKYALTLFDFGGLQLKPPTQADREQLGRVIHDAFLELQKGSSLSHVIDATIKNEKKSNHSVENLVRLQQALLALNDFKKYVSNDDLAEILKYLQKKEMIHPEIQKTAIGRAFSSNTVAQFMQLLQKKDAASPSLCIEINRALLSR